MDSDCLFVEAQTPKRKFPTKKSNLPAEDRFKALDVWTRMKVPGAANKAPPLHSWRARQRWSGPQREHGFGPHLAGDGSCGQPDSTHLALYVNIWEKAFHLNLQPIVGEGTSATDGRFFPQRRRQQEHFQKSGHENFLCAVRLHRGRQAYSQSRRHSLEEQDRRAFHLSDDDGSVSRAKQIP